MADFRATYRIRDHNWLAKSIPVYGSVADDRTIAETLADGLALAYILKPITEGKITVCDITLHVPLDAGLSFAPAVGSDCEAAGLVAMYGPGFPRKSPLALVFPATNKNKFPLGRLDQSDFDVIALDGAMSSGIGGLTFSDAYGMAYTGVADGHLVKRKNPQAGRR